MKSTTLITSKTEINARRLFQQFVDELNAKGLIFNEGQIIDASFVLVPKQHNTRDENKDMKKIQ